MCKNLSIALNKFKHIKLAIHFIFMVITNLKKKYFIVITTYISQILSQPITNI